MRVRDAEDERNAGGRNFGAAWRACFGSKGSGFEDPRNCDIEMEGNKGGGSATGHGSTTVDMGKEMLGVGRKRRGRLSLLTGSHGKRSQERSGEINNRHSIHTARSGRVILTVKGNH
jgi:hypothetical protein